MFEVLTDPSESRDVFQSDWFKAYQEELKPLLAAPPEATSATPVWAKGFSL